MEDFIEEERRLIAHTYLRQPIMIKEASGAEVKDVHGKTYIDFFSGIAVNNVGHCHPAVVEAIKKQAERLIHTSNIYYTEPQLKLARLLNDISGGYRSFFCNSGAEANEAAIKLARKHTGKSNIITAENSFHGRTLATLAATGQERYRQGFDPLPEGFSHVPFGDAEAVEEAITEETAAVMIEPIQGEGGVVVPPEDYLRKVAATCEKRGVLLILDEVQTGFGRTGDVFAWQGYGVEPDIFTVAKALGGGMPIGAMLARPEVMDSFGPGDHASTFGGNPVACAAAAASVEVILREGLAERARELGRYLIQRLEELQERHPSIREVRGRGLMIGVELDSPCQEVVDRAREKGLLLNCVHEKTLRLAPPLIIDRPLIDEAVQTLDEIFAETKK
ncbi:MAG: acetylornithine transaminase [Methanobacteriota archaeon]|nr:MAG: acetylornithine transaminase [Euryarchaeota archaeon]